MKAWLIWLADCRLEESEVLYRRALESREAKHGRNFGQEINSNTHTEQITTQSHSPQLKHCFAIFLLNNTSYAAFGGCPGP